MYTEDKDTAIVIVLTSCFGVATTIIVSLMPGFTLPLSSTATSSPATDLGSMMGFVQNSGGLPVECLSSHLHMGLTYSTDKNAGYIDYIITESDGSYSFDDFPLVYIDLQLHIQTELFK